MKTKQIKVYTVRCEGDKWLKAPLKIVKNPEMSNSETICFGWTNIPIGNFKEGWSICVVNENDIPIIVPGEEGDEVLIIPEYMQLEKLNGISLKKPFHKVMGLKIYNYKNVSIIEKETQEQTEKE